MGSRIGCGSAIARGVGQQHTREHRTGSFTTQAYRRNEYAFSVRCRFREHRPRKAGRRRSNGRLQIRTAETTRAPLLVALPIFTALSFAAPRAREPEAADPATTRAAMEEVTTAAIFTMGCVVRASMRYVGVANRGKSPFEAARRVWIKSISPVLNKWHDESLIFYLRLWAIFR